MKWLKILLILTALFSSGFAVAGDKSICDVRDEARQGIYNGSLDDISTFKVCKSNVAAKAIYYLASTYFQENLSVKAISSLFDFKSENLPKQSFDIVSILNGVFLVVTSSVASFLLILKLVRTLGGLMTKDQSVGAVVRENKKLVISYLLLAVIVSPFMLVPIAILLAFIAIGSNSFVTDDSQLFVLDKMTSDFGSKKKIEEDISINSYETSESAISKIAVKELQTRNALLRVKAIEIQKGEWDQWGSSTLTKGDVLRIIENDVKLVMVPKYQNNKFKELSLVWNGNFKEYDERAFGPTNVLETISFNNLANIDNSGIKSDDIIEGLIVRGFKDGQEFMPASKLKSSVDGLKNIIYQSIHEGRGDGYKKYLDKNLVASVRDFLATNVNSIKKDLMMSGIREVDTTKYLSVYYAAAINSLRGGNPAGTYAGKYESLKGFALAVQTLTCSKDYEKHEILRKDIAKFNAIPDGTPFAKESVWMGAAGLDMSCATIKGGRIVYTGLDLKNDPALEKSVIATVYAEAEAGNLYDSQIVAAVLDSANDVAISIEGLRNSILANTGVGPSGAAKNIKAYTLINTQKNYINMAVYNSVSVSYSSVGENDRYLDYTKLSNQKNFDLFKQSEGYRSLTLENRTIPMVDVFIGSGSKSNSSLNSNDLAYSETSSNGFFDDMMAKIQNEFTAANQLKTFMGMDATKSFESGIEECERTDNCERRNYGTAGDMFSMGGSLMNVGTTIISLAATADALDAVKDMSQMLSMVGIDGSKGAGKLLGGFIDFFSSKLGALIDLIQIITSILKPLGWLLFFVGIFIGYWLPILPLLMSYMLDLSIALTFLTIVIMAPIFVILGHLTEGSNFYLASAKKIASELAEKVVRGAGIVITVMLLTFFPIGYFAYEPFSIIYTQGIFAPLIAIAIVMLFTGAIIMVIIRYSDKLAAFTSEIVGNASITASAEINSAENMVMAGTTADVLRQASQKALDVPAEQAKKLTEKLKTDHAEKIQSMSESKPPSNNMQGSKE